MSLQEGNDLIPDEEMAEAAQTGHFGLFSRAFLLPGKNTVVKQGTGDLLIEAQTMCYVRRNTSIPVPKVYELRGSDNDAQLFMEHISGSRLSDVWPALSADDQAAVVDQLRGHLAELAAMTSRFAGAIDVSPVRDSFFAFAPNSVCTSEQEFNTTLLKAWYLNTAEWSEDEPQFPTLWQTLNDTMRGNRFVMTYNNLDPRNILVRGSQVVALLDWSQAGFLPEYWEYCRPWMRSWEKSTVVSLVDNIKHPYIK
ncbi:phosphotransferase enzyme family protein [Hypoxylon rubiginosum]|uniref:Phosphotransferase enzyme family protein n=1 Tax=Hypoxylon rubiginosum TaxID=110542 RepID=A0ACC0CR90_9PEZI|nr:phosphotransferase enzyme family protein [Hypoxylon rubiginosum]